MPSLKVRVVSVKDLPLVEKKGLMDHVDIIPLVDFILGFKLPDYFFMLSKAKASIISPLKEKKELRVRSYKVKEEVILESKFDPIADDLIIELVDYDLNRNAHLIGRTTTNLHNLKMGKEKKLTLKLVKEKTEGEIVIGITAMDFETGKVKVDKKKTITRFDENDIKRDMPHLSRGSYGIVYTGKVPGIKEKVVIKDMEMVSVQSVEEWKKEIELMCFTKCPYTVDIIGYSTNSKLLTIVMEYMQKGSLYDVLHKRKENLSAIQRMRMARHCALGVQRLHNCGVIHRDIKSMNILVTEDYSCKLTDFGCGKVISDGVNTTIQLNTSNSGTPLWMAPEVKTGYIYDYSADIYSLGLVIYELFENQLPGYNGTTQSIVLPRSFRSQDIVLRCISKRPSDRLKADQVVEYLNSMIDHVLTKVRAQLPKEEEKALKSQKAKLKLKADPTDLELIALYNLLLQKDPLYVDKLIDKAFSS